MRTFKQLMAALMLTTAMPVAAQSEGGLITELGVIVILSP